MGSHWRARGVLPALPVRGARGDLAEDAEATFAVMGAAGWPLFRIMTATAAKDRGAGPCHIRPDRVGDYGRCPLGDGGASRAAAAHQTTRTTRTTLGWISRRLDPTHRQGGLNGRQRAPSPRDSDLIFSNSTPSDHRVRDLLIQHRPQHPTPLTTALHCPASLRWVSYRDLPQAMAGQRKNPSRGGGGREYWSSHAREGRHRRAYPTGAPSRVRSHQSTVCSL